MAGQVRIISKKNTSFDHHIADVIDRGAHGVEHFYYGITDLDRAVYVRNKLVTAGKHMDPPHAVKAFRVECRGCNDGGPECRFHISFTVYDMDKARAYKEAQHRGADRAVSH